LGAAGVKGGELVYGVPLSLPGPIIATAEQPPQFFVSQLQSSVPAVATKAVASSERRLPSELFSATHVYVRTPAAAPALSPAYRGPYLVHKRSPKFFILKMGGTFDAISVDRLKPHLGGDPVAVPPPKRGRPPGSAVTVLLPGVHHWGGGGYVTLYI
jgi:hypothetical protein